MKQATKFIHAGAEARSFHRGNNDNPFIKHLPSAGRAGKNKGYENMPRSQNPTRKALEDALAIIENGKYGLASAVA